MFETGSHQPPELRGYYATRFRSEDPRVRIHPSRIQTPAPLPCQLRLDQRCLHVNAAKDDSSYGTVDLPQSEHPKQHIPKHMTELAGGGGGKIGIVGNAGMTARARKREIVNNAKLRLKNDGQRRNT